MEKESTYQIFNDNRKYAPIIDHRKESKAKQRLNWTFIVTWATILTVVCFLGKTLYNLIN